MKRTKIFFITLIISVSVIVIAFAFNDSLQNTTKTINGDYSISKTWELPSSLDEISGISWIDKNTMACVQDEQGIIFIYDLNKKSIIKEITFADAGDYEGIAIVGKDAFVMRSDGLLYEISDYNSDSKSVKSFQTSFDAKNNMETLTWDQQAKSLITSPKDRDSNSDAYKGVYQISTQHLKSDKQPIFKIDMNETAFKSFKGKKEYKTFNPSDIAIHPKTHDMYVLEGKNPKLLVLDSKGQIKTIHHFNSSDFPQPEGITFSPEGAVYISNEAKNGKATIHLVEFN